MKENIESSKEAVTEKDIAKDLLKYLRENPGVCARANGTSSHCLRYNNGEWQLVKYGGKHRLRKYVDGNVLDPEDARKWIEINPISLIPTATAPYGKRRKIWTEAHEQGVFADVDRCQWCGESEHTVDLELYETTDQGKCNFCPDCHSSWDRAGEIKSGPLTEAT